MRRTYLMAIVPWLAMGWCYASESGLSRLRDSVEVHGNTISLSDLLVSADASLREAARAIELGHAPKPGTARLVAGEEIARRLGFDPRFRDLQIPQRITVTHPGWSVARSALGDVIGGYLRERGWSEEQIPAVNRFRWPEMFRTLEKTPRLEVTRLDWNEAQHVLELRVRCAVASACGSFLVQADLAAPSLPMQLKPVSKPEKAGIKISGIARKPCWRPIVAPAGKRATLILENAAMRISLLVIPLERGAMGQQIRVREWRGQRIYEAQVVGPGLLRAGL